MPFIRLLQLTSLFLFLLPVQGVFGQSTGTLVSQPDKRFEAITWMADGTIYIIDFDNGNIHKRRKNGQLSTISLPFINLAGGGAGPDGRFYFSDFNGGRIYRLNSDNSYTLFASGIPQPVGVQLNADSTAFYAVSYANHSVHKITYPDGVVSTIASGSGINGPDGIVQMDDGDLLVANYNDNKLHRVSLNGAVSFFGSHPDLGNMGYVTKAGDYFYVPSIQRNAIARFDEDGNATIFAGAATAGHVDGDVSDARFQMPNGITSNVAGDTLLIAEANGRVRFITDLDNTTATSLTLDPEEALEVFPQPFQSSLSLRYTSPRSAETEIKVFDVSGRLWHTQQLRSIARTQTAHTLRLPELPRGIYLLQVWEEGLLRQARRITKQ